jgi:hypothetical protein
VGANGGDGLHFIDLIMFPEFVFLGVLSMLYPMLCVITIWSYVLHFEVSFWDILGSPISRGEEDASCDPCHSRYE